MHVLIRESPQSAVKIKNQLLIQPLNVLFGIEIHKNPCDFCGLRRSPIYNTRGCIFSPRPTRFNFALCILNFAFAKPTIFTQSVSDTKKADLCGLLFALKYRVACFFVSLEKLVAKGNDFVGGKLCACVWVHHSGLVNLLLVHCVCRFNCKHLSVDVGAIHSR